MRKPKKEIQLTSYDELLGINEAEQNTLNQIVEVPLNELHPFRNHPFHVNDDEKMAETVESIKNYGILNPALVRPRAEGGYELIKIKPSAERTRPLGCISAPLVSKGFIQRSRSRLVFSDIPVPAHSSVQT